MLYKGGDAHALFYALCNLPGFDETHIHGVVVGFGCLLQLVIDGDEEEYNRLRDFNKRICLPVTFTEIGITLDQLESVLDSLLADEDVEHYPYQLTKEMIMKAAARLV